MRKTSERLSIFKPTFKASSRTGSTSQADDASRRVQILFDIDANSKEMPMKHEFSNTAPLLRLVFAVAALSVSLSIGGWIDFLASGYAVVSRPAVRPGADRRTEG